MGIAEYKKKHPTTLRQATLCFLIKENKILLAMKKRGFGKGRWNGTGGKQQAGEKIENTAIRETREEIGVTPGKLKKVATLNFYYLNNSDWNQQVLVYFSKNWEGTPTESEEMLPKWHRINELPFASMWPDDIFWLPIVLEGKILEAEFLFGEKDAVLDYKMKQIKNRI